MKYLGNLPDFNIIHSTADRYDYVNTSNPAVDTNSSTLYASWLNVSTGELFHCTDNATGANTWVGNNGTKIAYLDNVLIHHYPLLINADDVVGSSDGIVSNSVRINNSASFFGTTGSRILLSSTGWDLDTTWAIEIIGLIQNTTAESTPLLHITNASWGNVFSIWYNDTDDNLNPHYNTATVHTGLIIPKDRFVHYIISSDTKIYLNGILGDMSEASGLGDLSSCTEVNLGSDVDGSPTYNNPLKGVIKSVKVFNRAVTQTEVTKLYNLSGV